MGLSGCISFDHKKCEKHEWTCVCNPVRLYHRSREVGGFACELEAGLKPIPVALPPYIPNFLHNSIRCARPLNLEWIALPLYTLFRVRDDSISAIANSGAELRQLFSLAPDTRIVVTGPGPDQPLEDFWRFHRNAKLFDLLLALGVDIFTVPNFSFFLDSPPLHHRYNRSRILRVAERASAAGLSSVLHLNALHEQEWRDWEKLLKAHPEISIVCLEFQTGYRSPEIGDKAFDRLVALQRNVGRPLHPILVGGAKYADRLGIHFSSSTIIDAHPFIKTVKRRILVPQSGLRPKWKFHPSQPGEPFDARLKGNVWAYAGRIADRMKGVKPLVQPEFPFRIISKPITGHRRQKPLGDLPLFSRSIERPGDTSPQQPSQSSALPNRSPTSSQTPTAIKPTLPRSGSATSPANSHRRNNLETRQPSASGKVKTMGGPAGY